MRSIEEYGLLQGYIDREVVSSKNKTARATIDACVDMAFQNIELGSIFVVELSKNQKPNYYTKSFPKLRSGRGRRLSVASESDRNIIAQLAGLSGATIIDSEGELKELGASLTNSHRFLGHGRRHSFALGTSKADDLVCIVASEEDGHMRIFRKGVCVVDIDSKADLSVGLRPKGIIENLDIGWNHVLGPLVYPLALLSLPATFFAWAFPPLAIWSPAPVVIAYGLWIGGQYHIGKRHKSPKVLARKPARIA
jgi:hypothetical protein